MNDHTAEDKTSPTRRRLLGGIVVLGVAGMVIFGVMASNAGSDPNDEPDTGSGEVAVSEGTTTDPAPVDDDPVITEPVEQPRDETDAENAGEEIRASGANDAEIIAVAAAQNRLLELCASVQHSPPPGMEETAVSGIWLQGRLGDGSEGWIYVEGSAFNGGVGVQMPVINGTFEGTLGITSTGDHPIDTFLFTPVGGEPMDFLPTILEDTGGRLPVGPDEGPVYEAECLDFEPVVEVSS